MSSVPVYDLCSLSEFRHNDFLISSFAPYLKNHHKLRSPHRHNFYHFILFTKGAGYHTVDFKQFPVKPGQIYFMVPGQVHSWEFTDEVDGYIVNFTSNLFQSFLLRPDYLEKFSFFRGIVEDSIINLPADLAVKATEIFEELLATRFANGNFGVDKVRVLLLELFLLVNEAAIHDTSDTAIAHNLTLLKNFQKLIDLHFLDLKLPKDYASMLFVTPNHLNALSKEMLGKSAGEVIRDRVILEAKRLLINRDVQVSEIAYKLNFSDNSNFTKFFKKQVGTTPEEFRKQILNQK